MGDEIVDLSFLSLVVIVLLDEVLKRDAVPGRETKFSLTPVCWLGSFAGSFAVLKVTFQPFTSSPVEVLGDMVGISEVVAAKGAVSTNETLDANGGESDDETETYDDIETAEELVTAGALFVIVLVTCPLPMTVKKMVE